MSAVNAMLGLGRKIVEPSQSNVNVRNGIFTFGPQLFSPIHVLKHALEERWPHPLLRISRSLAVAVFFVKMFRSVYVVKGV